MLTRSNRNSKKIRKKIDLPTNSYVSEGFFFYIKQSEKVMKLLDNT